MLKPTSQENYSDRCHALQNGNTYYDDAIQALEDNSGLDPSILLIMAETEYYFAYVESVRDLVQERVNIIKSEIMDVDTLYAEILAWSDDDKSAGIK